MKLIFLTAIAYSHGILPTVTIVRDGTHVRINESDYDPETMEIAPGQDIASEPEQHAPVDLGKSDTGEQQPAPQLIVMKQGKKFFIADLMGAKIEGEAATALGISDAGYATEVEGQAALAAIAPQT